MSGKSGEADYSSQRNGVHRRSMSRRKEGAKTSSSDHEGPTDVEPSSQGQMEKQGGISQYMDLDNLDMLRSVLCLWILLFHSLCFIASQMTDAEAHRISIGLAYGGYIAVDGFLVLTGFLVSLPYVKLNSKISMTGKSVYEKFQFVAEHHYKRFVRIVPPLAAAVLLHCYLVFPGGTQELVRQRQLSGHITMRQLVKADPSSVLGSNCENAWGAFFFVNHLQLYGGTLMHLWSLAVQYHFYLLLPIVHVLFDLSYGKRFLYVTLMSTIVGLTFRAITLLYFHSLPVNSIMQSLLNFHVYSFTLNRIHSIWIGGLAAWIIERYPGAVQWLRENSPGTKLVQLVLLAFGSTYVIWNCFANEIGVPKSLSYSLFLHVGSAGSALVWCYSIYLIGSRGRSGAWVPEIFSTFGDHLYKQKLWKKLAQLSYIIFLIHPTFFMRLYSDPSLLMPPSKQDVPTPVVILRDGVSTSTSVFNSLQGGNHSDDTALDIERSLSELKTGFSKSATAFLDDDEWEAFQDRTFANTTRSTWKMISRLEPATNYQGPVIPGTAGISRMQFLLYTGMAFIVIVIISETLRRYVVDPITKVLLSSKTLKSVMTYAVVLHSLACIGLSIMWHGGWIWMVAQYLTPELEAAHSVGQHMAYVRW
eukprot:gb/GECG01009291.1/.p1 GENE.gb/GECG01009291.1/~~gb/GECG01009291.1/.p1  ORF type:complete len:644 (+),score=31.84 gb/GECG01009291.1/:1-1932(+)